MSGGAEVAMAFCREVLGWRKVEPSGIPTVELMWLSAPGGPRFLRLTEIHAVLTEAEKWCNSHQAVLEAACGKGIHIVRIRFPKRRFDDDVEEWEHADCLCEALMLACLAANRRLKAEA